MSIEMDQRDKDCRESINSVLSSFGVVGAPEHLHASQYLPHNFEEPERQQFISLAWGIEGCRERHPTLVDFWVYALFDFLETQMQD
jgi:hypothetical protein